MARIVKLEKINQMLAFAIKALSSGQPLTCYECVDGLLEVNFDIMTNGVTFGTDDFNTFLEVTNVAAEMGLTFLATGSGLNPNTHLLYVITFTGY